MKFLKWAAIAVAGIVLVVLAVGFALPRTVSVERSTVIPRPQATVYTVLADHRQFNEWSPWAEADPAAEYIYEGAPGVPGARITWKSEGPSGYGSQELIEAEPYGRLVSKLVFGENGEQGEAVTSFTLLEVDGGTEVTWSMEAQTGAVPWERLMGLFARHYVGAQYEKALKNLEAYMEKLPEADFAQLDAEVIEVEPVPIAYMTMRTSADHEAIGAGYQKGYETIWAFMQEHSLSPAGMPLGINTSYSEEGAVFDAAMPIAGAADIEANGPVKLGTTYGGKALRAVHKGPYAGLEDTYRKAEALMIARRLEKNGRSWEHFVTDPGEVPESEIVTHLYFPVK